MCANCRASFSDSMPSLRDCISSHGYTVVTVGGDDDERGWAYTIGLVENFDHPELVVAGVARSKARWVVNELAQQVADGHRFDEGEDPIRLHQAEVGVRPVHQWHLDGQLLAAWHWFYEELGRWDVELRAIQFVVPDSTFCYVHQTNQPRLDRPHHASYDGPTRSGRRPGHRRGGRITPPGTRPQPSVRNRPRNRRSNRR